MRSTPRRFLAAILLTAAAGFALSQEASAPPPPAPDAAAPAAGLPQLPVVAAPQVLNPNTPAVDPAVTNTNLPDASADMALAKSEASAAAAVKSEIPETPAESHSRSSLIIGEWVLAGVLLVALYGITQMLRRRPTRGRTRLIDLKALELKPRPVTTTRLYRS
jgi:hypothetical protein